MDVGIYTVISEMVDDGFALVCCSCGVISVATQECLIYGKSCTQSGVMSFRSL